MTGDRKGKKEYSERRSRPAHRSTGAFISGMKRLVEREKLFLLSGALLQILLGLGVVTVSILGLLRPLWFAALFMVFASANVMAGLWSLYRLFSSVVNLFTPTGQAYLLHVLLILFPHMPRDDFKRLLTAGALAA